MKQSFYDYCVSQGKEALLQEFDTEKNPGVSLATLTHGSHQALWWRCGKGHSWQAAVKTRVAGTGCPYCANRMVVPGENDLATTHPDLIPQWDAERNAISPNSLTAGTRKKVWWHCEKGHPWQAMVASRARGAGCPVCAGKEIVAGENDLGSCFPAVAAQWDTTRNGTLSPQQCAPASNRRVWWRGELGHSYQAAVGARTVNGSGCPYCAGKKVLKGFNDLATLEPKVAESWHPTLNGSLTPNDVTTGSRRKVWWLCPDGHTWKAVVYSRGGKQKAGCPVCAGRVPENRQRRYSLTALDTVKMNINDPG